MAVILFSYMYPSLNLCSESRKDTYTLFSDHWCSYIQWINSVNNFRYIYVYIYTYIHTHTYIYDVSELNHI